MHDTNLLENQPIAWTPTEDVMERAQLTRFMRQVGVNSFDELYQYSINDIEKFTAEVLRFLDIKFDPPAEKLLDLSNGVEFPNWLSGAGLNITEMCLDRWQNTEIADQLAVIWEGENGEVFTATYKEVFNYVEWYAAGLRGYGFGKGDAIGIFLPMIPQTVFALLAINRIGAIAVPVFSGYGVEAVASRMNAVGAKALFATTGFSRRGKNIDSLAITTEVLEHCPSLEKIFLMQFFAVPNTNSTLEESDFPVCYETSLLAVGVANIREDSNFGKPEQTLAEDPLIILYTSGTTGTPKGAELSHLNVFLNSVVAFNLHVPGLDYTDGEQKTCLITLPLFHTTGQTAQMNAQMFAGHRIVLLPRFEPHTTLEAFRNERVNFWTGVPTMYWALLKYVEENDIDVTPYKESVEILSSGGAPMPVEVMKKFQDLFECQILEGYGLSETSPISNFNHPQNGATPGSVGKAVFGVEVRCVDDDDNEVPRGTRGEVVMRGHNIMKGYYKRPEATAEAFKNGWFHSGDIGIMDEDGNLSIVDRKKEMILRGGYNVYPRELEEVMMTHPAVSLVAVIGVPDEKLGEEIKAFVVKKQGAELTEEEFTDWCKEQFAANKYPRFVEFRDALPIGGTGKIQKRALKEEIQ